MPNEARKLTVMQQRFVDCFSGSATEAARLAGYKQPHSQGPRLLEHVGVKEAIRQREALRNSGFIANRRARQIFWTKTMLDDTAHMTNRLRASELLGRSEGDFLEKTLKLDEAEIDAAIEQAIEAEIDRRTREGLAGGTTPKGIIN